jgi:hypothetical protein
MTDSHLGKATTKAVIGASVTTEVYLIVRDPRREDIR